VVTDVLGSVFGFTSQECGCGNRRAEFYVSGSKIMVHSRSILKKKWSDARAVWNFYIHKEGESTRLKIYVYVTAI